MPRPRHCRPKPRRRRSSAAFRYSAIEHVSAPCRALPAYFAQEPRALQDRAFDDASITAFAVHHGPAIGVEVFDRRRQVIEWLMDGAGDGARRELRGRSSVENDRAGLLPRNT